MQIVNRSGVPAPYTFTIHNPDETYKDILIQTVYLGDDNRYYYSPRISDQNEVLKSLCGFRVDGNTYYYTKNATLSSDNLEGLLASIASQSAPVQPESRQISIVETPEPVIVTTATTEDYDIDKILYLEESKFSKAKLTNLLSLYKLPISIVDVTTRRNRGKSVRFRHALGLHKYLEDENGLHLTDEIIDVNNDLSTKWLDGNSTNAIVFRNIVFTLMNQITNYSCGSNINVQDINSILYAFRNNLINIFEGQREFYINRFNDRTRMWNSSNFDYYSCSKYEVLLQSCKDLKAWSDVFCQYNDALDYFRMNDEDAMQQFDICKSNFYRTHDSKVYDARRLRSINADRNWDAVYERLTQKSNWFDEYVKSIP